MPEASSAPIQMEKTIDTSMELEAMGATDSASSYTLADVAMHATADDCWMAIKGSVYNMTEYIAAAKHPGGETIVMGCGKDATEMFMNRPGDKGPHPDKVLGFAEKYKLGTLAE